MVLLVVTGFHHANLGLQVVIEDYVHTESTKITCLILNNLIAIFLALAAFLSALKMLLGG